MTYGKHVSPQHVNFQISECGLFVNPSYPTLGASPDGIISCDCCGIGTLEIKCPYCSRNSAPETATDNDDLKCLERNGKILKLKEDNTYFYQVQAQLHICNVEFGDFVVWTPRGIHIERIYPQHDFFESAANKAEEFYKQAVMLELLGKWYTKMPVMPPVSNNVVSNTPLQDMPLKDVWCYCKQPEDDKPMIACDYRDCLIQWFHLDCLKLSTTKIPKGNWYCPDCRKKFTGRRPPCKKRL